MENLTRMASKLDLSEYDSICAEVRSKIQRKKETPGSQWSNPVELLDNYTFAHAPIQVFPHGYEDFSLVSPAMEPEVNLQEGASDDGNSRSWQEGLKVVEQPSHVHWEELST